MEGNFLNFSRESVAMYETVGDEALVELQHLLAVLIGSRATPELTGRLAQGGVQSMLDMSVQELEMAGLTHLEALRLHSTFILAKKMSRKKSRKKEVFIRSPEDVADYLMPQLRDLKQEHFVCLSLDTKNKIIKNTTLFIGSLNSSVVHPREVFKEALRLSSASIIIEHNHTAGDPTPSREDVLVTKRIAKAGELMGIQVLDHIIIGCNKYVSLKEKGHL